MKNSDKRKICVFVILILVALFFTACGGQSSGGQSSDLGSGEGLGHTHSYGEWTVVDEATCSKTGLRVKTCSCGDEIEESISYTDHDYQWVIDYEPTEQIPGSKHEKCVNCTQENSFDTVIPALCEHEITYIDRVEPECEKTGLEGYYICSKCNGMYRDEQCHRYVDGLNYLVIKEKGHSFTNYFSNIDATCVENGTKTAKCDRCDVTDTIEAPNSSLGHSFENYVYNGDATCVYGGTQTAKCNRCDETNTISASEIGDHKYVDGICELCKEKYYTKNLKYTLSKDGTYYSVSMGDECTDENIVIPEKYNGLPVNGIDSFYNCDSIVTVEIPKSVTYISTSAFTGCDFLESIVIPESVTNVGVDAFSYCSSLKKVEIYGNTSVGMFSNCRALETVIIGGKSSIISIDMFYSCTRLTSVEIGDSVQFISASAFKYCYSLESIKIGSNIAAIGDDAFGECEKLAAVYYEGTESKWNELTAGKDIFYISGLTDSREDPVYYYSEQNPTDDGNYWHYDEDKKIVIWE